MGSIINFVYGLAVKMDFKKRVEFRAKMRENLYYMLTGLT